MTTAAVAALTIAILTTTTAVATTTTVTPTTALATTAVAATTNVTSTVIEIFIPLFYFFRCQCWIRTINQQQLKQYSQHQKQQHQSNSIINSSRTLETVTIVIKP